MDEDFYGWKKERYCRVAVCDRPATIGYETCARCRLCALATRHPEVLGPAADRALPWLSEKAALSVERPFRDALNAGDVARARLADLAGAPTAVRPAGEDVARTFVAAGEAADARA